MKPSRLRDLFPALRRVYPRKTMLRGGGSGQNEILQYLQKMEKRLERRIEERFQALLYMPPEMRPFEQAKQRFEAASASTKVLQKPALAEAPGSLEDDL
jgi:hypothetical protein